MRNIYFFGFLLIQLIALGQLDDEVSKNDSLLNTQLADSTWLYTTTNNPNFYKKEINDSIWQKAKTSLFESDFKKLNFTGFA